MGDMLTCTIRASRRLGILVLGLHGLAVLGIVMADIGGPAQLAGFIVITVSAAATLRRRLPVRLRCLADGGLLMAEPLADWQPAELLAGSLVLPLCTVLRVRIDGRTRSVVVLADSLGAEDFRRLRVWLRWRAVWPSAPRWPVTRRPVPRP